MNFFKKKLLQRLYGGDVKRMIDEGKIPDQEVSLRRIKELGFSPKTIFDVGAYQGDFSKLCLNIWPQSHIHAFEPLPDKKAILNARFQDKNVKVVNTLVGEQNRNDVQFYADETASSIFESQEFTPKKRMNLPMITLDSYISANETPAPDFLKTDSQGYEYQILKGFEQNLGKVQVILLELITLEIYYQVTLPHEVINFLAGHGFVIYDICEIHRRPLDDALVAVDFLFVKKNSVLREDKRWDEIR